MCWFKNNFSCAWWLSGTVGFQESSVGSSSQTEAAMHNPALLVLILPLPVLALIWLTYCLCFCREGTGAGREDLEASKKGQGKREEVETVQKKGALKAGGVQDPTNLLQPEKDKVVTKEMDMNEEPKKKQKPKKKQVPKKKQESKKRQEPKEEQEPKKKQEPKKEQGHHPEVEE